MDYWPTDCLVSRAFVKGDGIADNVFLLRCLLRDRCEAVKPFSLTFLDVSKAFDSVSHESLLLAVKRMGVPGPFVEHLRSLYAEASTTLQVGDQTSDPLQQNSSSLSAAVQLRHRLSSCVS